MAYCELCNLDDSMCVHGYQKEETTRRAARRARAAVATLLVSPRGMAHFAGCPHKGDDPDLDRWATLDAANAWTRLGNGERIPVTGGSNLGLVATSRCSDCVRNDGPWL